MDLQRLLLAAALSFTLLMIWQAWQQDYGQPLTPTTSQSATATPNTPNDAPQTPQASGKDLPGAPAAEGGPTVPSMIAVQGEQRIHVKTDVYDIVLDSTGGDLRRVDLIEYPVSVDKPDEPFRLMDDGKAFHVAQAALLGAEGSAAPNHKQQFRAAKEQYTLADGSDTLEVRLNWQDKSGVSVDKIYTFHRGSYVIDVAFEIKNGGSKPWSGYVYRQLQRNEPESSSKFIYTYTGGVIYSQAEKYEKIKFDDMKDQNLDRQIKGGWAAMIQHYFLSAWIPPVEEDSNYYSKAPGNDLYLLGMISPETRVAPGASEIINSRLYVGPKLQDNLAKVAPGLELTVDYGFLTIISKPLFFALELIHGLLGNWGWSIIVITILLKAAFYKLSETSYKSMANMRKMQPKMAALKERYGDDKEAYQQAMMKMYKDDKINPLGGCLPILVQIPVFIAFYWMLLETVEMRQAPFMLWIQDLSTADPYYVLPVIMGITMLIQHKLNPTPLDPMQARVMMILPIAFTFFFLFFPSGLVLYWVVNNTLSIAQQWYITRVVIAEK